MKAPVKPNKVRPGIYDGRAVTGRTKGRPLATSAYSSTLLTLEVQLMTGPMPKEFAGKETSRTIEMLASHMLLDLHDILLIAFDREEENTWGFYIGGKGFYNGKNKVYGPSNRGIGEDAAATHLGNLGLKVGDGFGYRFDFRRDWQHCVQVLAIASTDDMKMKPRIVKKIGKSPPQYPAM